MQISISSSGFPSNVDAEIKSMNVNLALYDGFFGDNPVSPTLKASVADGLRMLHGQLQIQVGLRVLNQSDSYFILQNFKSKKKRKLTGIFQSL